MSGRRPRRWISGWRALTALTISLQLVAAIGSAIMACPLSSAPAYRGWVLDVLPHFFSAGMGDLLPGGLPV